MTKDAPLAAGLDMGTVARVLGANRYLVLGTADPTGTPWVSPVFFAPLDHSTLCWVSSPDSRHSRNLTARPAVAITVFDSTVEVGKAEAVYFDAQAAAINPAQAPSALDALNLRLPPHQQLSIEDIAPHGQMVAYRAEVRHRYLLVRGGNPDVGNPVDITVEV